jgi:ABC-type transport system involved in multi-copper enzyme maturation permease subunit
MRRYVTNPMIIKELRQRLRERRSWLLPTLYLIVLSGIVVCVYYFTTDTGRRLRGAEVQGADIGQAIFLAVVFTQVIVLLLMGPVFSSGAITIEREQRTLAGLLTSLLTAPQIWWGKFVAALLYLLLLLASAIPLLALPFAFGGVEPLDLVKALGSTILTLASICTIGLWCSATFRRSVHATASCYAIVLVLTIVTAIAFGMLYAHWQQSHPGASGPPAHIQAPLFLNPLYPLLPLIDDNDFRLYVYPVSSWLLFAAVGCLAAAFAMRRLQRSGEQL